MGTRTVFFHGLEHDDGEAPCHQDGLTTLAISQPHIRTNAKPGDIVIALMSHKLKRSTKFRFSGWKLHDIVYISEVQSALCWPDYAAKYPARRDCIYSFEDGLLTQKRNAYSHDWTNVLSDINTSGPCVLLLNAMQICEPGHSANGLLRGYGTTPEQEPHTTLVEQGFFMKQLNSDETIELDNSRRDLAPFAQKPATAQLHGSSDKQRRARMKWEVEPVVDWTVDDVCAWVRTVIRRDRASSGAICDAIKQIGVDGLVLQHLDAAALTEDPPRGLGVKRSMDRALLLAELQKLASRGQMPKGETEWAKQLRKNEGGALRRRWNSSSGARQIKPIRSGQELQNQRIEIEILREEVDRLRGAKHDHRPASLNVVNGCSGCKELAGLQRALRAAEESLVRLYHDRLRASNVPTTVHSTGELCGRLHLFRRTTNR
eukprot:SAG31_NODE_619_length_13509_cov_3.297539_7_plen_431_part_00